MTAEVVQPRFPDVVAAVRAHLASHAAIRTVVGPPPGWPNSGFDLWLFQDRLLVPVEGCGAAPDPAKATAVVLSYRGGHAAPNAHNRAFFPRLSVEVYADPNRDARGNVTDLSSAEDRVFTVLEVLDPILHRTVLSDPLLDGAGREVGRRPIYWPAPSPGQALGAHLTTAFDDRGTRPVRVLGSTRTAEPELFDVPEGDRMVRAQVYYALNIG